MLLNHRGAEPSIDPAAYVAPSAVVVGKVHLASGVRVLHGAVISAEDGEVARSPTDRSTDAGADPMRLRHPPHRGLIGRSLAR
jgi:hypothetical protein